MYREKSETEGLCCMNAEPCSVCNECLSGFVRCGLSLTLEFIHAALMTKTRLPKPCKLSKWNSLACERVTRSSSSGLGCVRSAISFSESALNISQCIAQIIWPANKIKYGSQWDAARCVAALVVVVELVDGATPCCSDQTFLQVHHPVTFALFNVMTYSSVTELTNHREQTGMSAVGLVSVYLCGVSWTTRSSWLTPAAWTTCSQRRRWDLCVFV